MYYTKPDIYFIIFGCVSLLTFLAFVFLNPKSNKTDMTTEQVIDSKMLKEARDDTRTNATTRRKRKGV